MDVNKNDAFRKIKSEGVGSVHLRDLVSVFLCREERDVYASESEAKELLDNVGHSGIRNITLADLQNHGGLEGYEAFRILAAIEYGRRQAKMHSQSVQEISGPEDAYEYFKDIEDEPQENFRVVFLNTKNQILASKTLHVGTINMSVVSPRDVFRQALEFNTAHIVLAHNHPSGDPTPSQEDIEITKKLASLGKELGMPILDHLIIGHGHGKFVSLQREGIL